jgi:GT2 family glycosyltransferase/glycosyltransferase involved in cell wall biosynthesis
MRVLLVVHGFPPSANGGTEIYVHDFARALASLPGMAVSVLTRDADSSRPEYSVRHERTPAGVAVFRVNNTFQACTSFEDSYTNPAFARVAAEVIERVDPDVIHVQHLTCLSTGILDHAAATHRPVVMTLNDYWLMCHRGQFVRRDGQRCEGPFEGGCAGCVSGGLLVSPATYRVGRLARALPLPGAAGAVQAATKIRERCTRPERSQRASWQRLQHLREATKNVGAFLAPSATMESWALTFGIARARLSRCNQGIDLRPFARVGRTSDSRLRLLFAGSLIPSKAPHVLLEAVAMLSPDRLSVDLLGSLGAYHGDTAYAERLSGMLGGSCVRKLGPVPHERMAAALADADVLVVPSVWIENAPFIIREAFAAGLPVIASDLGGMAEMVTHDRNGLLFAPGDPTALRAQLSRLLEQPSLLDRLRSGIERPMSIEQDAAEMKDRYEIVARPRVRGSIASTGSSHASANRITAIVLNYRTSDQTWLAVHSIQSSHEPAKVIVVDNGPNDESAERLRSALVDAHVIATGQNLGFSGGCNVGIREALRNESDLILLVNSDVVLSPHAIGSLRRAADANPRAGILAPVLLSREEPDRIASAGIRFSASTGRMRHIASGQPISMLPPGSVHAVDAVSGCVVLIRRSVFEKAGLLDERFFFSFEDIEFCLRARRAGFDVLCVAEAIAYHEGGRSIGRMSPDRVYYAARNHLRLVRMTDAPSSGLLRGGLVVGLNAGYVLLSGETPRLRGLAALARGVWHHLNGRYGPA